MTLPDPPEHEAAGYHNEWVQAHNISRVGWLKRKSDGTPVLTDSRRTSPHADSGTVQLPYWFNRLTNESYVDFYVHFVSRNLDIEDIDLEGYITKDGQEALVGTDAGKVSLNKLMGAFSDGVQVKIELQSWRPEEVRETSDFDAQDAEKEAFGDDPIVPGQD